MTPANVSISPIPQSRPPISGEDRRLILDCTSPLWPETRKSRFFVTGGTGFVGCWVLEALTAAEEAWDLGLEVTVLTRDPQAFRLRVPHLATHRAVSLIAGDIRNFSFPGGDFPYVIHGAFDSSQEPGPEETSGTIVSGAARCLEFARRARTAKLLLLSSGAVYGRQASERTRLSEELVEQMGEWGRSVYGDAKLEAERLALEAARSSELSVKIARGFAFVGPHLRLDGHFAIGNFIRDAMGGGPIRVRGDGTPLRSYLYAADLAVWLLTVLLRGEPGRAYNVGSEEEISIAQLARRVAAVLGAEISVDIASGPSQKPAERYVPSTLRARRELGLLQTVDLDESIRRTAAWYERARRTTSMGPSA